MRNPNKSKKYEYSHEEISMSKEEFIVQFIDRIIEAGNLNKKKVDSIYNKLVHEWEDAD